MNIKQKPLKVTYRYSSFKELLEYNRFYMNWVIVVKVMVCDYNDSSCIPMAALADECLNINKKFGWMRNKVQLKRTYYRYQRKKERITESNKKKLMWKNNTTIEYRTE